jgi:RNA polymerase sigma-70 factor (ECF subfamily)
LLQITANLSRNHRRSAGRYWAALKRKLVKELPQITDFELVVGQRNRSKRLWQATKNLSEDDQKIIYLRYFLDLPVAETATTLKIAEGTVKSRTSRALNRLREQIEMNFPDLLLEEKNG